MSDNTFKKTKTSGFQLNDDLPPVFALKNGFTVRNFEKTALYGNDIVNYVPEENAVRIFSKNLPKSQIFRNLYIYSQLEESSLNVPKINKVYPLDGDRWGILEQNIRGKDLLSEMSENGESYDEFLETLIDIQMSVYDIEINDLLFHKFILKAQINSLDIISEEKKESLINIIDNYKGDYKLIHGNFSPECVVTDKNEIIYIKNWASVAYGSPLADAAMSYLNLFSFSTESAERYLKIYSEKCGYEVEQIREWIPIMSASQLAMGAVSSLQHAFLITWLDLKSEEEFSNLLPEIKYK